MHWIGHCRIEFGAEANQPGGVGRSQFEQACEPGSCFEQAGAMHPLRIGLAIPRGQFLCRIAKRFQYVPGIASIGILGAVPQQQ